MRIVVERDIETSDATLSKVYIDDAFNCFGLEDEYRDVKVAGETRIPEGTYDIGLRRVGRFHEKYQVKFPFHEGMLEILRVPNFSAVLIHPGNTEKDTAGCLLVGRTRHPRLMMLGDSVEAYSSFYQKVLPAARKNDLTITFRRKQ